MFRRTGTHFILKLLHITFLNLRSDKQVQAKGWEEAPSCLALINRTFVVYFDQHWGAAHSKSWLNMLFQFLELDLVEEGLRKEPIVFTSLLI